VRGSRLRLRGEKGVKENDEGPIVLLSPFPPQGAKRPPPFTYGLPNVVVQYQPYFESLL
jgi:hypothetical protein